MHFCNPAIQDFQKNIGRICPKFGTKIVPSSHTIMFLDDKSAISKHCKWTVFHHVCGKNPRLFLLPSQGVSVGANYSPQFPSRNVHRCQNQRRVMHMSHNAAIKYVSAKFLGFLDWLPDGGLEAYIVAPRVDFRHDVAVRQQVPKAFCGFSGLYHRWHWTHR